MIAECRPLVWGVMAAIMTAFLLMILSGLLNKEGRARDRELESTPGTGLYATGDVHLVVHDALGEVLPTDEADDTADDDTRCAGRSAS